MGEHWVRSDLVDRALDLARPSTLQYAVIGDRRVLVGVAYTQYIGDGDPLPDGFAGDADTWHVHDTRDIAATLTAGRPLLRAIQRRRSRRPADRPRLAMVHVWTELENPDGPFAQHHRVLPYLRAGLPASYAESGDLAAANGIALLGGEQCDRERWQVRMLARADDWQREALSAACQRAGAEVRAARTAHGSDAPTLNGAAARAWRRYIAQRDRTLTPEQRERLGVMMERGPHH